MTTKTIYVFKQYEAGPFMSRQEAEQARDQIVLDRFGDEGPDDWDRDVVRSVLEIVPVETEVWVTDAPESYDGFGTTTIEEIAMTRKGRKIRVVAVPVEHVKWQTMRYQSGVHLAIPADDMELVRTFAD